ncbi:MAG: phosphate/phosphite/phosphonate ABC transporter substrate-binding protein, partial [Gemmatimonadota bacterium]|nr:phosphate/phosphite/phosphonate ABC transporter substrate-binding protein [Gemmatimonadota bacterium]
RFRTFSFVTLWWCAGSGWACSPDRPPEQDADVPVLRLGLLGNAAQPEGALVLGPYLRQRLGRDIQVIVRSDYEELVELARRGEVDLVRLGGAAFALAQIRADLRPLVMRDVDSGFRTALVAAGGVDASGLGDLRGMRLALTRPLSTSGHVMPLYFLRREGVDPDTLFANTTFFGGQREALDAVLEGRADVAAVHTFNLAEWIGAGQVDSVAIRVLWTSPPYPNVIWGARGGLGEDLLLRIRTAFLSLATTDPMASPILEALDARSFVPADIHDFDTVAEAVRLLISRGELSLPAELPDDEG